MKNPKVLFLLGPAGSGKTTMAQKYLKGKIDILNVDDEYELLLKQSGIGTNLANFGHDELSIAAKCLATSHANLKNTIQKYVQNKQNFCYDGTGGSYKVIEKMVYNCLNNGYLVSGMICWSSPYTCISRNYKRERSLKPSIIARNWYDVNKNLKNYRSLFAPRFYLLNTDVAIQVPDLNYFDIELAQKIFPSIGSGKIYTEQEKLDKQKEFQQLSQQILELGENAKLLRFDNPYLTQQRLEEFIK